MWINLSSIFMQIQLQKDALDYLRRNVINYRPTVYEDVKRAYDRLFAVRLICFIFSSILPVAAVLFCLSRAVPLYDGSIVIGHRDDGAIWYIQNTQKFVPDPSIYTGTDDDVLIYFNDDGSVQKIVAGSEYDKEHELWLIAMVAALVVGVIFTLTVTIVGQNRFCWQWCTYYEWYHKNGENINEFLEIYDRRAKK